MESTKCQRIFYLLTLWAIIASLFSFSIWKKKTLTPRIITAKDEISHSRKDNQINTTVEDFHFPRKPPALPHQLRNQKLPVKTSSSFRRRFLVWDRANQTLSSAIGPHHVITPDKYLIYRCDSESMRFCGGWADRVKGVLLTYVIANLTGRVFKVEMLNPPCDLLRYVTPNLVDWSLPTSFHEIIGKGGSRAINKVDNVPFLGTIHQTNFTEMIEEKRSKYIYFKANFDYSDGLQKSKIYSHQLSWMRGLSNDLILSTLFKRVFKLSPYLQQRMDVFMKQALPTTRHRLICAHVRMGANPTIPSDSAIRFHEEDLAMVWKFLSKHSRTDEDKVFFMSDSENAVRLGQAQPFGHRMVESGGPVNHVDKSGKLDVKERCAGLEKVIFDQHVLMQCDVLLLSLSGVSRMAAYIRGSTKGLYCLLRKGKIVPCKPENIKKLYRIMG